VDTCGSTFPCCAGSITGLEAALKAGADIITIIADIDNRYWGEDIARLIQPILEGRAGIVLATEGSSVGALFAPQAPAAALGELGCEAGGIPIPDATSPFRAFTCGGPP